jgi:hypothetical protein
MTGKYEFAREFVFDVLDRTQPCSRCKRPTLAVFDGKGICSICAGVWDSDERAAMLEAIRRPFPINPKPYHVPKRKDHVLAALSLGGSLAALSLLYP